MSIFKRNYEALPGAEPAIDPSKSLLNLSDYIFGKYKVPGRLTFTREPLLAPISAAQRFQLALRQAELDVRGADDRPGFGLSESDWLIGSSSRGPLRLIVEGGEPVNPDSSVNTSLRISTMDRNNSRERLDRNNKSQVANDIAGGWSRSVSIAFESSSGDKAKYVVYSIEHFESLSSAKIMLFRRIRGQSGEEKTNQINIGPEQEIKLVEAIAEIATYQPDPSS